MVRGGCSHQIIFHVCVRVCVCVCVCVVCVCVCVEGGMNIFYDKSRRVQ